jgi:hypothetical protein
MTKENLEEISMLRRFILGVGIIGFLGCTALGYVSCVEQRGSISKANQYILEGVKYGLSTLDNAPMHACTP